MRQTNGWINLVYTLTDVKYWFEFMFFFFFLFFFFLNTIVNPLGDLDMKSLA